MSTTPNMSLVVPEVLVTTGPQYATQINAIMDVIDAHDHSSGKGVRITPSGLNINNDLPFNNNSATNIKAVQLAQQTSVSTNAAIYNKGGDLYYRRGDGTEVRITTAAGVNVSGVGGITGLTNPAAATYTPLATTFSWLSDASTYAKTGTGDLSIYSRFGATNVVQAVTLVADLATSAYSLRLPAAGPADNQLMRMKAATAGAFVDLLGTNNQVTVTHNTSNITLSLPQNIDTGASPTFNTLNLSDGINMAGAIAGATTGSFSGQVNVGSLVSANSISATSGTFSGNISLTGAAGATISGTNYAATFGSVTTDGLATNLITPKSGTFTAFSGIVNAASGVKTDTLAPYTGTTGGIAITGKTNGIAVASGNVGYTTRYTPVAPLAFGAATIRIDNLVSFTLGAGEWEVEGNVIIEIFDASGNAGVKVQFVQAAISTTAGAWDDDSYLGTQVFSESSSIYSGYYQNVYAPRRTLRTAGTLPVYLVTRYYKTTANTNAQYLAGSYIRVKRIG